jgi:hypothetical protein
MQIRKEWIDRVWKDPVWSKVISSIIIAALSAVGLGMWSLISGLAYGQVWDKVVSFLGKDVTLPLIVVLLLGISLLSVIIFQVFRWVQVYLAHRKESDSGSEVNVKEQEPPIFHYGKDYHFFYARLASAFPGWSNEIRWYNGKNAVDRLSILLAAPLEFKGQKRSEDGSEFSYREIPLWWFRDTSSMHIERYQRLDKTKILINEIDEYVIDKIAVHKTSARQFDFIYVETLPEKPTGAYDHKKERIDDSVARNGYYWEEYAMVGKSPVTLQEYDDGAAEIGGKVVQISHDVKKRMRYLTKYNFIITVNSSPFNSRKFEMGSLERFNALLSGATNHKEVFDWMLSFDRRQNLMD